MRGTPLIAPLRQPGTNKRLKACGDQHTSHPLGSEAKILSVDTPVALLCPYARGLAQVCKIH